MQKYVRPCVALATLLTLSGCAAELSAVLNRDLRTDTVSFNQNTAYVVVSTTGERRSTFFKKDGRFCPENFPDTGRATNAKADVQGPVPLIGGSAHANSQFETTLTATNQRSEAADLVGRMGAIICVAYLNGAITPAEYKKMIDDLMQGAVVRMKSAPGPAHATTSPSAQTTTKTTTTPKPGG